MTHRLFAAEVSMYSGKARAYLRYKGIPFEEVLCTRRVIRDVVKPRTGLAMVPVLITDDDVAVQDTTAIIDHMEARYPERSVYPSTPKQRLVALLMEVYGDEWLMMPGMHYRWHYKRQNLRFILAEFGRLFSPTVATIAPAVAGIPIALYFGGAYGPVLGIGKHNRAAIERWYEAFLDAFDAHLAHTPYLLGDRPCVGDFGFMAPLYAHLYRDPYPGAMMRRRAPRVADWVERMNATEPKVGDYLPDDTIPETLTPILRMMFDEHLPVLSDTLHRVAQWVEAHPHATKVPRFVGRHTFHIGGVPSERQVQSFSQWMVQRPLDHLASLPDEEREAVERWLTTVGGEALATLRVRARLARGPDNRLHPARSE
jgi:glutathione S-transferase